VPPAGEPTANDAGTDHPPTDGATGPGPVPTGCEAIDDLLGGGFERGTVTQLYGPPAAGKTNVAMAAAVTAAIGGETVVYVDTEGLSIDRLETMIASRSDSVDEVASRIVVSEAHDFTEQEEAVRDAADLAERAGIIVVDSVTGFYRLERTLDGDDGEALRKVARQVTHLLALARKHDLAVVLTNQVYTDPEAERTRPLGGHTLAHWSGTVVRLERFRGGNRRARLEQHRSREAGETARFRITEDGLESVEDPAAP
jgi:DNA repair protein RadB